MKQFIERVYYFEPLELKEAIWDYLKKIDRPIPAKPQELDFTNSNTFTIKWREEFDFKGNKE